jgi:GDPmannose 4,6-dehydratase
LSLTVAQTLTKKDMGKRVALITGVTGQDGAYLAEFLLAKGYDVHGIKRRASLLNTERVDHLYEDPHAGGNRFFLHYGDLSDSLNVTRIIQQIQPDEIYNLGAMSHVKVSFETPEYVANVDGVGILRILEAVRLLGMGQKTRIYQASTSELFGLVQEIPQTEKTPFYPRSPYGVAKLYAYWITVNYREAYNLHASNGILFNHESPVRGETFVTRKITRALSRIVLGMQEKLYVGNLSAKRDWGHAKDFVKAMYLILQQDQPDDYVIATGVTTSIRDFIKLSGISIGLEIEFKGTGLEEKGYIKNIDEELFFSKTAIKDPKHLSGKEIINVDSNYFRPTEVDLLIGDPSKAKSKLGWVQEYTLEDMIKEMMDSDLLLMKKEAFLKNSGFFHQSSNE